MFYAYNRCCNEPCYKEVELCVPCCFLVKSSSPTGEAVLVDETEKKPENQTGIVKEGQLVVIDTDETIPAKTSSPTPSEPKPSSHHGSPEHSQGPGSRAQSGDESPMATSITTGSAHTLEGSTQIYENRAYDEGTSISGSEQATDVSPTLN